MTGYGAPDFDPGDTPGATDFDGWTLQGHMVFDDATDRDTQLTGREIDGMIAYTQDDKRQWIWDGDEEEWVLLTEPVQAWSPSVDQGGAVSATVDFGYSQRHRGTFEAWCGITMTGAGAATNPILISTPFNVTVIGGTFNFYDDSLDIYRSGEVVNISATELQLMIDWSEDAFGVAGSDGLTSGDVVGVRISGVYA